MQGATLCLPRCASHDGAPDAPDAATLTGRLAARGIQVGAFGPRRIRVVTHLDVGPADADALVDALSTELRAA